MQRLFLGFLVSDHDLFVRCNNILDSTYFSREARETVAFLQEYADEYGKVPEINQITAKTGFKIDDIGEQSEDHRKWFMDEFEQFCQHKALEAAIFESVEKLERHEYNDVQLLIKKAGEIGLAKEFGIDYFEDPAARIQRIKDNKGGISTGWTTLDQLLYGGFNRGELKSVCRGVRSGQESFLAESCIELGCTRAQHCLRDP